MKNKLKKKSIDIDIPLLIASIWREKYLVLSTTILFLFISLIIPVKNHDNKEILISSIILRDAPYFTIIDKQLGLADKLINETLLISEFNNEIKLNLITHDLLLEFLREYSNIDKLKSHLKKKNITLDEYFKNSITFKEEENTKKLSLKLQEPYANDDILQDYVLYVKKYTENLVKQQLQRKIISIIDVYERNLRIATQMGLNEPVVIEKTNINFLTFDQRNDYNLFYLGTVVLKEKIEIYRKYLKSLDDFSLDYNPILKKTLKPILTSEPRIKPYKSPFVMALIGLLFSFMIKYIQFIAQDVKKSINTK